MHVIADRSQLGGGTAIDQLRLVAAAKEMAPMMMPPIRALGIGAQQPLHAKRQVRLGCFHHQMKMITQETIGVHLPAGLQRGFTDSAQKLTSIGIIKENRFSPIAPAQEVVKRTFVLDVSPE